jgi:predicted RecA/RadA family phage recombinase
MALIPLNTFKTKTAMLTTSSTATIYTAPIGTTAIILMTQVTNTSSSTQYVNFGHFRRLAVLPDAQGNGGQPGQTFTPMVVNYAIPKNNATNVTTGKMIVESLDSVRAWSNNGSVVQVTLSVLETANA